MLLQLGNTQPKATWTPPTEETSAVAWFRSCNSALSTTGDVFLQNVFGNLFDCFLTTQGKRSKMQLGLVKKESWRRACKYRWRSADEVSSWGEEKSNSRDREIEWGGGWRKRHSGLDGLLLTVYKDIRAWQGAMPNKAIHQSWGSPSQVSSLPGAIPHHPFSLPKKNPLVEYLLHSRISCSEIDVPAHGILIWSGLNAARKIPIKKDSYKRSIF